MYRRTAAGDFFGDLVVEVVFGVLGFPVAADEVHLVFEGAVGADVFVGGFVTELRDEGPVAGAGGVGEEGLEGGGDSAFVEGVLVGEFLEGGVVVVEEFFEGIFGGLGGARGFGGGLAHLALKAVR